MNRFVDVRLFFLVLLAMQIAMAAEFQKFKKLNSAITLEPKIKLEALTNENLTISDRNRLIHENIDKNWVKPPPKFELNTITPGELKNFQGGTGTRGGGSGLIVQTAADFSEVKLLEIYRSENLSRYSLFFQIDDELLRLDNANAADESTQIIFETVLSRISQVAPQLAGKIEHLYKIDLPFQKWIPVFQNLPTIDDEISHPLEENTDKIQIAYRRTNLIMYNTRAYVAMKPLSRAALWLHEYLYALSGLENSIKTQRAVSLFFSSDFLKIATDETRLTQLFFDLDLLGLSRKTLATSLPLGTKVTSQKQLDHCGQLASIKGSQNGDKFELAIAIQGQTIHHIMARTKASAILTSVFWAKIMLEKTYPLYKFYGQKIMPDKICFNSSRTRITQVQSSLAIDESMAQATQNVALAEVEVFKAKSVLTELFEKLHTNPDQVTVAGGNAAFAKLKEVRAFFFTQQQDFESKQWTPIETVRNPKILAEYYIAIDE